MFNHSLRLEKFRGKLAENGLDGFLVTKNTDLYYFTGSMQTGYLFVPTQGEPVYYVRRSLVRAREESAVLTEKLGSLRKFGEMLKAGHTDAFGGSTLPKLGAAFDTLPVQLFRKLEAAIPANWTDGSHLVREVRMLKSPAEIAIIRKAAHVTDLALQKAREFVKPGMSELELISMIELTLRLNGHMGLMRMRGYNQELVTGMVGSGEAAAMSTYFDGPAGGKGLGAASPQSAGHRRIRKNEPILVDIGCCIEGYVFDQTRTLAIGPLESDLARAYEVAEAILRSTEQLLKPGTPCEDLYANALQLADEAGLSANFMGYGDDQVRFLGHGIGLEVDELPVLARGFSLPLAEGMVIAVEPKFTFPGRGVVGIENTYAITQDGFENLSYSPEGILYAEEA